ncbi:tetratricopeptide repeat protein [Alphaproteobacteria bacterium]|nr:tetratricopeptide repeat protein [Alphaproteobacteria bacterium]
MTDISQDQFTIGLSLHKSGKFDDATYYYEKALKSNPNLSEALVNLAIIKLGKSKLEESESLLNKALDNDPKNAKALSNIANIYQQKGLYKEAENFYKESIEIDDTLSEAYYNLGTLYLKTGKNDKAEKYLQLSIGINPKLNEAHIALASALINLGKLDKAEKAINISLKIKPNQHEALFHLGIILYKKKYYYKSEEYFRKAVNLKPDWTSAIVELAKSLEQQNKIKDARSHFKSALNLDQNYIPGLAAYGLFEIGQKNFNHAEELLLKADSVQPDIPQIQIAIGQLKLERGETNEALKLFKNISKLNPDYLDAKLHIGITYQNQKNHDKAILFFEKLHLDYPDSAEILNNLANSYSENRFYKKSIDTYKKAIKLSPKLAVTYINIGNAYRNESRFEIALESFKKAMELDPKDPRAFNGAGLVYQSLNKENEAIKVYQKAYELEPDYPEALNNLAVSLQNLGKYHESIKVYKQLIEKHPEKPQIYFNLGTLLQLYGRHDESVIAFRQALDKDPNNNLVYPFFAHALMQQCSWDNLEAVVTRVIANTKNELEKEQVPSVSPFGLQCMPASKKIKKRVAEVISKRSENSVKYQKNLFKNYNYKVLDNKKIRIGFVSPDFRRHSVAVAFKGVLESRNKSKYEYHAYCISTYGKDNMTKEFENLFDSFTDITLLSHEDTFKKIHSDGINILIDLAGHTRGCRYEVFALKPAPIQAHWLGFSSTTGANFIDYLITDKIQNPINEEEFISEKLVHLPHTFMATSRPRVSSKKFTRKDQNLPSNNIVFANFNSHYKFYPSMFSIWMRLLKKTPGSVLWLLEGSKTSRENLYNEALKRGIKKERIIFAKSLPHDEHLSRIDLADLCLDNQYHGGGVTTTDALWVGVPVLTLHGDSPPSRNGSSLLTAIDMEELITYNLREYEDKALSLVNDKDELTKIKLKIINNRDKTPLFDIKLLTKNLEKSFEAMWSKYKNNIEKAHITIK